MLEFRSAPIDNATQIIKGKEYQWKGKDEGVMLQNKKANVYEEYWTF